ncbi:MAG: hypothetical protein B6242_15320 [Anaerolineaceae bacterium 4572_78]|nr:MAG: hypothetical protein B6242_15320 [Anaerolineaceae bacterium 4572_78]
MSNNQLRQLADKFVKFDDNEIITPDDDDVIYDDEIEEDLILPDDEQLMLNTENELFLSDIPKSSNVWKILVVDDEQEIHSITKLALRQFEFEGKPIQFHSVYSGKEAKSFMEHHADTALILLDVVMETNDAGLQVAEYVRKTLKNRLVRVILRTGQPGEAPEESVILEYDINDYRTKMELRRHKLFTVLVSALRSYQDLTALESNRKILSHLNDDLTKRSHELESLNEQLQHEIAERKRLEKIRIQEGIERERLQVEKEFHEKEARILAKLNANKDKFFSIISHDLRSPFLPLLGLSEILFTMLDNIDLTDAKLITQTIHQSAKNIYNLLDNLLIWSRLQMEHIRVEPTTLNLNQIVDENIKLLRTKANTKGIILRNSLPKNTHVQADKYMIDTIIRNLMTNSLKFTPNEGIITISGRKVTKFIEVSVTDTGVGVSRENIKKLFRIDTHHSTEGTAQEPGTGLGLILCQEMVLKNGGKIWLESVLGKGTTVKFTIPAF